MSNLRTHIKQVHEGTIFNCEICSSKFSQKSNLKIHLESIHIKERYYSCEICDYKATLKSYLSKHVKRHQKLEKINCTDCNKIIQKKSLTLHNKIFHSGEQTQYKCNVCTFQTIHEYGLLRHAKHVHQKGAI